MLAEVTDTQSQYVEGVWSPPVELQEYRLIRLLGQGSVGAVWLAEDTNLQTKVAIKFLLDANPDSQDEERFLIEARAIARLSRSVTRVL